MKIINYNNNNRNFTINNLNNDINIIFIYSNSCFHCHAMMPDWNKVKEHYKKTYISGNIIQLEANDLIKLNYQKINEQIKGYPTLMIFNKGKYIKEYNGNRTSTDIIKYINSNLINKINDKQTKKKIIKNNKKTKKTREKNNTRRNKK